MNSFRSPSPTQKRILSFETEERLANDFAFVSAAREGVGSVTAVCIEEKQEPLGLIIRLAANDGVRQEVKDSICAICNLLAACATGSQYK